MSEKKKILVLTGSPRKGGNTLLMADAFVKGATAAGHQVMRFDTAFMKVQGCRACDLCFSKEGACVFNDDFNKIAPHIEDADTIVFVTPLYWYNFSAQIKLVLDKMYSLVIGERDVKIKESLLLSCCGDDQLSSFEGLVKTYGSVVNLMGWRDAGQLLIISMNAPGDIKKSDALEKAENLGGSI